MATNVNRLRIHYTNINKVLPFAAVWDRRQLQRFKNEARAAASLDHPNIVSVYVVRRERGVHYYAMRYVEGRTLAEVIGELRRLEGFPPEGVESREVGTKPSDAPDNRPTLSTRSTLSRGTVSTRPTCIFPTPPCPRRSTTRRNVRRPLGETRRSRAGPTKIRPKAKVSQTAKSGILSAEFSDRVDSGAVVRPENGLATC